MQCVDPKRFITDPDPTQEVIPDPALQVISVPSQVLIHVENGTIC